MSITFTWKFQQLDTAPTFEGLADVIRLVHWRYVGTDGTNSVEEYGEQALNDPDPQNFTAFGDVTSAMVEGWVIALLSIAPEGEGEQPTRLEALQTAITQQIAAQAAPELVAMRLEEPEE